MFQYAIANTKALLRIVEDSLFLRDIVILVNVRMKTEIEETKYAETEDTVTVKGNIFSYYIGTDINRKENFLNKFTNL